MPSWSFAIGHQRNLSGTRFICGRVVERRGRVLADHLEPLDHRVGFSGGLKLSSTRTDRAGFFVSFSRSSRIGWTTSSFGWLSCR